MAELENHICSQQGDSGKNHQWELSWESETRFFVLFYLLTVCLWFLNVYTCVLRVGM